MSIWVRNPSRPVDIGEKDEPKKLKNDLKNTVKIYESKHIHNISFFGINKNNYNVEHLGILNYHTSTSIRSRTQARKQASSTLRCAASSERNVSFYCLR